jgi:hypothetical protein
MGKAPRKGGSQQVDKAPCWFFTDLMVGLARCRFAERLPDSLYEGLALIVRNSLDINGKIQVDRPA